MPCPNKKTISASQAACMFGKSPYCTRWMLWQHFKSGMEIYTDDHERIEWGNRLEGAILDKVADELKLEVTRWDQEKYIARGHLGCTKDAIVYDPQAGYGAVEAKNVDYFIFKEEWTDHRAPEHIELQLQCQMWCGDGETPYEWGVIAVLIGGNNFKIYKRKLDTRLMERVEQVAKEFFASLKANDEPSATGIAKEIPFLTNLHAPKKKPSSLYVKGELAELVKKNAMKWDKAKMDEKNAKYLAAQAKAFLLQAVGEHRYLIGKDVKVDMNRIISKNNVMSVRIKCEYEEASVFTDEDKKRNIEMYAP